MDNYLPNDPYSAAAIVLPAALVSRATYNSYDGNQPNPTGPYYIPGGPDDDDDDDDDDETYEEREERLAKEKNYNTNIIPIILEQLYKCVKKNNVTCVSEAVTKFHNTDDTTFNEYGIPPKKNGIKDAIILSTKYGNKPLLNKAIIKAIEKKNRHIINLLFQSFHNKSPRLGRRMMIFMENYNELIVPAILQMLYQAVGSNSKDAVKPLIDDYNNAENKSFKNGIPPETNGIKDAIILSTKYGNEPLLFKAIEKKNRDIINLLFQSFDNESPSYGRRMRTFMKSYNELIVPAILQMLHQAINSSNSNDDVKQLIYDYNNNDENTSFKNGIPPKTNGIKDAIILSTKDGNESLLITLIKQNNVDIVTLLLDNVKPYGSADMFLKITESGKYYYTPLDNAIEQGNFKIVELLIPFYQYHFEIKNIKQKPTKAFTLAYEKRNEYIKLLSRNNDISNKEDIKTKIDKYNKIIKEINDIFHMHITSIINKASSAVSSLYNRLPQIPRSQAQSMTSLDQAGKNVYIDNPLYDVDLGPDRGGRSKKPHKNIPENPTKNPIKNTPGNPIKTHTRKSHKKPHKKHTRKSHKKTHKKHTKKSHKKHTKKSRK
jgi:hypothetical protein